MKIVALSDTHGFHYNLKLPEADVIIHSGDFCKYGREDEFIDFVHWFSKVPIQHKILVAGNHDMCLDPAKNTKASYLKSHCIPKNIHYLENTGVEIDGVNFWGSPFTPIFGSWAFMRERGRAISKIWNEIPKNTHILITHGPPYGHGDLAPPHFTQYQPNAGCFELLKKIIEVDPIYHFFGHIHGGYGITQSQEANTRFVNSAICTEGYKPTNQPQLVELAVVK